MYLRMVKHELLVNVKNRTRILLKSANVHINAITRLFQLGAIAQRLDVTVSATADVDRTFNISTSEQLISVPLNKEIFLL